MNLRISFITVLLFIFTISATAQIKTGDAIPSIELKNSFNEPVNLSNLNGKFLVIDFWASWCAPCRLGNKKLVKIHANLDNEKITIVGISLDTDTTKWKKAIEKDKIKFLQLIDPNGFEAKTALLFGVDVLPSKYIFNSNGILIKINPTEEELINLIKQ